MNKPRFTSLALELAKEHFHGVTEESGHVAFAQDLLARVREEEGKDAVAWRMETGYEQPQYFYQSDKPYHTYGNPTPLFLHPQEKQWISVEDRLPKHYEEVLVYPPPTDFCITASYGSFKGLLTWKFVENEAGFGYVDYMCNPTHWMPLPKPPAAKEDGK